VQNTDEEHGFAPAPIEAEGERIRGVLQVTVVSCR